MTNQIRNPKPKSRSMDHLWLIFGLLCMLLAHVLAWLQLSDWSVKAESPISDDYRFGCVLIILAGILFFIWPRGRWVGRSVIVVCLDLLSIVFLMTVLSAQSKNVDVFATDPFMIIGLWIWTFWGVEHLGMLGVILYLRRKRRHRRPLRRTCRKCGYDLRGLPSNRCPECGTAINGRRTAPP